MPLVYTGIGVRQRVMRPAFPKTELFRFESSSCSRKRSADHAVGAVGDSEHATTAIESTMKKPHDFMSISRGDASALPSTVALPLE
jgi:hypothetical protein